VNNAVRVKITRSSKCLKWIVYANENRASGVLYNFF
jgi:hypothetical protein